MTVWPARTPEAARPAPADTLALYNNRQTESFVHVLLDAIKDQISAGNSADISSLPLDFGRLREPPSGCSSKGRCPRHLARQSLLVRRHRPRRSRLPASWRILYRDNEGSWQPAKTKPLHNRKDALNQVDIDPFTRKRSESKPNCRTTGPRAFRKLSSNSVDQSSTRVAERITTGTFGTSS